MVDPEAGSREHGAIWSDWGEHYIGADFSKQLLEQTPGRDGRVFRGRRSAALARVACHGAA